MSGLPYAKPRISPNPRISPFPHPTAPQMANSADDNGKTALQQSPPPPILSRRARSLARSACGRRHICVGGARIASDIRRRRCLPSRPLQRAPSAVSV